jgi:hypothetical protein
MSLPARKFEREKSMEGRVSVLEAHYEHIKADVQELRNDVQGIRQEMKELNTKLDAKFELIQRSFESMRIGRALDRVWLLLSMGAMLGVMARGFKWI